MIEKNSEKKPSNEIDSKDSIKQLHFHISKMSELTKQAKTIDHLLGDRLQDLKNTSQKIVKQFKDQTGEILQRFDHWIIPIAKDVLDGIIQQAELQQERLDQIEKISVNEWKEEAKNWIDLHSNWVDRKSLISKILEKVSERTKYLIAKDIRIIKEYQTQSLAHLPKESEVFKSVEKRLEHAIEEPLKQLISLANQPKDPLTIQQVSEWVSNLQQQRENYFNQLLVKIEQVMKETVQVRKDEEEPSDWSLFVEIEGEILFLENELHEINKDLIYLESLSDIDKQFILVRAQGFLEHVQQFEEQPLPVPLKKRLQILKEEINFSISLLTRPRK